VSERVLYYAALGAIVARERRRKKLTQDGLAKQLGISQATVARLEAGAWAVPAALLSLLTRALDLGTVGRFYALVDTAVEFIQRAADVIRPGSLERVAPQGLAAFVVAALGQHRTTAERRPRT
jgi:transcriptional regulator with XRE-family HTH domain